MQQSDCNLFRPGPKLLHDLPDAGGGKINVESLLLLEAQPGAGESDAEIVAGAWDFERINRRHARHLICRSGVSAERRIYCGGRQTAALYRDAATGCWAATEREAWLEAVTNDPLLPGRILPSDYLGQQAWRRRVEVLRDASRQLRTFKPE
jgi:DNA-binding transcriptional regulator PaaX